GVQYLDKFIYYTYILTLTIEEYGKRKVIPYKQVMVSMVIIAFSFGMSYVMFVVAYYVNSGNKWILHTFGETWYVLLPNTWDVKTINSIIAIGHLFVGMSDLNKINYSI